MDRPDSTGLQQFTSGTLEACHPPFCWSDAPAPAGYATLMMMMMICICFFSVLFCLTLSVCVSILCFVGVAAWFTVPLRCLWRDSVTLISTLLLTYLNKWNGLDWIGLEYSGLQHNNFYAYFQHLFSTQVRRSAVKFPRVVTKVWTLVIAPFT